MSQAGAAAPLPRRGGGCLPAAAGGLAPPPPPPPATQNAAPAMTLQKIFKFDKRN